MLDDFEDVDLQLANPTEVFTNVKRLEEIQTDFLNEDQRSVAKELWGYEPESFEGFRHNQHPKDEEDIVFNEFKRLTEMLLPIYETFTGKRKMHQVATRGMIAREAVVRIEKMVFERESSLPRYIGIIGFSTLTRSEREIFRHLKSSGVTEFFWDVPEMLTRDLPDAMIGYRSPLAKYIDKIVRFFPMPVNYRRPELAPEPDIEIISVPANAYQTKVAGNILNQLQNEGCLNPRRADSAAVVLPNPALLMSMLHSMTVTPVNVTMGLPMRYTPFATLFGLIIKLNISSRIDNNGETIYLSNNVLQIISHTSLSAIAPQSTEKLRSHIENGRRFVVSFKEINEIAPDLSFIFDPLTEKNSATSAKYYLTHLIDKLREMIREVLSSKSKGAEYNSTLHEYKVLEAIGTAIDKLVTVIEQHDKYVSLDNMQKISFFTMVEKELLHEKLNLSGSPLIGVQIMGVLETRSLNFDNVIMLSMNEKTFPPRNFAKTLLPAAIRAGYGLTMTEERELQYAWIYANLISRCKKAFLLYDSASESKGKGGMSRYLFQTLYIYNRPNPKKINILPKGITHSHSITVVKTDKIMRMLDEYRKGGSRNLSVSNLVNYGECPLRFYLANVRRISEVPSTDESISDAIQGTVVHTVLQQLYEQASKLNNGVMDKNFSVTPEFITQMVSDHLLNLLYGRESASLLNVPNEAKMHIKYWSEQIYDIIEQEKKRGPYRIECCEMSPRHILKDRDWFEMPVNDKLTVRFKFLIDRVDRLTDNEIRFIDYKTGNDQLKVDSLDSLFWKTEENGKYISHKAIFQLLTYAHAYRQLIKSTCGDCNTKISLEITKVTEPQLSIGKKLMIGNTEIDYSDDEVVSDFSPRLNLLIEDIFNPGVPFTQTDNIGHCTFCQFKNICNRVVDVDKD